MSPIDRRSFLGQGGAVTVAGTIMTGLAVSARAAGAADRVRIGVVGCSRGLLLARTFAKLNAKVVYVCDTDTTRASAARLLVKADHAVADLRRILDDKSIDAVVIAAPDHWHAPAAILACEAGKHVYVEKPCAHNIREGRLTIETAGRTKRVVQVGSQSRSTTALKEGIQRVREGEIGKVLVAKAWNSQRRANIGHAKPSTPPAGFDYDLWVGPARMVPFQTNRYHYTWHWWYDFGTGDAGNDGVHELDLAAWGLGVEGHPTRVTGYGSKLFFDDDQQFPDTQYVSFEYPDTGDARKLLVYEQRLWSPYTQQGHENAVALYGTKGTMILSKSAGWQIFGEKDRLIREAKGPASVPEHATDFLEAIRSGRQPSADIAIGHRSATLAHLANIIARTGRPGLAFDPEKEQILHDTEADALTRRSYREGHWAVPKGV